MSSETTTKIAFAAIDKILQSPAPSPVELPNYDKTFIQWGRGNSFPNYMLDLYQHVTTLRSIILGAVDYTIGEDVTLDWHNGFVNNKKETIRDLVRKLAFDRWLFGGYAIQVIMTKDGTEVAELYHTPINYLRSDKDGEMFYYSENWGSKGRIRSTKYPRFSPEFQHPSSIYLQKFTHLSTYPEPVCLASLKACEIERAIDIYHLNSINNGFLGSFIFNFNSGIPNDKMKDEIERNVNEKFGGPENAGRIMLTFNNSQEQSLKVERVEQSDFSERYNALSKHCRQQLFSSFRATPNLFGITTESLGFSSEEYNEAFKLYNKTQIQPTQAAIVESITKILGGSWEMRIEPFNIEKQNNTIE